MNCPVRTDPFPDEGHNQNPPELAPELTTRKSLNTSRGSIGSTRIDLIDGSHDPAEGSTSREACEEPGSSQVRQRGVGLTIQEPSEDLAEEKSVSQGIGLGMLSRTLGGNDRATGPNNDLNSDRRNGQSKNWLIKVKDVVVKYTKFIGPGFMVSVAYIDPGKFKSCA